MFSKNPITGYTRIPRYRIIHNNRGDYYLWDDVAKDYFYYPEGHACKDMLQSEAERVFKSYNLGKIYK